MIKKIFLLLCVILFTGCSWGKSLEANVFTDLWDKFVIQEDTSVLTNFNDKNINIATEQEFAKISQDITDLRAFLIGRETANNGKIVFQKGLMHTSDEQNAELTQNLKETFNLINGKNTDQDSLAKELEKLKKNIQKTCLLQKATIVCQ